MTLALMVVSSSTAANTVTAVATAVASVTVTVTVTSIAVIGSSNLLHDGKRFENSKLFSHTWTRA